MVAGPEDQARSIGADRGMSGEREFSGSGTVRKAHRFDESRLAAWLPEHVPGYEGPLSVEQFHGGQSNPTYKLTTPSKTYVLRRKPPGQLLKGAHAIEREARVMLALEQADFPVAHVHSLCTDDDVIGSWFYVMDFVDGRVLWDATLPAMEPAQRPRYFDALNATMARLHCLDYRQLGLDDYARAGNYFERQIARWSRQYLDERQAGRDPNMDRLLEWLPAHIPADGEPTRLVHGDFRFDNVIFHPVEPRILAVLDWELSTLGHPLADFAYHLMMYRLPPLLIAGLDGADLRVLNIPSEAQYVREYCGRTGRQRIEHLEFYLAFNMFRLAAIFQGIKGRLMRGTAASAQAQRMIAALPWIAERAWLQAQAVNR